MGVDCHMPPPTSRSHSHTKVTSMDYLGAPFQPQITILTSFFPSKVVSQDSLLLDIPPLTNKGCLVDITVYVSSE